MKNRRALAGAGAVALVAITAMPGTVFAFKLLGFSLPIGTSGNGYQRDFRCDNNFVDPSANNNNTPDPNYPGVLGASMAVWKAGEVWDSSKGGGKNFDYDWQSDLPTGIGGQDDNIVSALQGGGCANGVLAFTESPGANGWRIRFCDDNWVWDDGPGIPTGFRFDIQGVGAHELGHALGLEHPDAGNEGGPPCTGACSTHPTMCAIACDNASNARTLEDDDRNGLQAIYGTIPGNKPSITGLSGSFALGGVLTITGTNFAATNNRVKFSANTTTNTGAIPGVVDNVPSSNGGTRIDVTIPATALDGNVLVWIPSIPVLSNPFPIDIDTGTLPPVITDISPSTVQAFLGGQVTITGSSFTGATDVNVQGVSHTDFVVVNDTVITFTDYRAVALGNADVIVTNPFGTSNTGHFTYVETDPPKLAGENKAFTGQPYTWEMGTGALHSILLISNATGSTIPYGGGALLFPFTILFSGVTDATGYKALVVVIPSGFTGLTFNSQFIDINNLKISNIISTTIL
jgi:hypothetical protein